MPCVGFNTKEVAMSEAASYAQKDAGTKTHAGVFVCCYLLELQRTMLDGSQGGAMGKIGGLRTWGLNFRGELGNNSNHNSNVPVAGDGPPARLGLPGRIF
jgi:hypothetical protein